MGFAEEHVGCPKTERSGFTGFGFRGQGLGFRGQGLGFKGQGLGYKGFRRAPQGLYSIGLHAGLCRVSKCFFHKRFIGLPGFLLHGVFLQVWCSRCFVGPCLKVIEVLSLSRVV